LDLPGEQQPHETSQAEGSRDDLPVLLAVDDDPDALQRIAGELERALASLDTDLRIALTHYSPVEATLMGERLELFPFLGSYLLGEAIDRGKCQLALHGHAHRGKERGVTPGGVPVRNVARPVIQHAYRVYIVETGSQQLARTAFG